MDEELKITMEYYLSQLEIANDAWADTPKRHEVSEYIQKIRKLLEEPVSKGYER